MSAHREFFEAQRLLNNLFHTGHIINDANVDYLVTQLSEHAYRMVINNRLAVTPTPAARPPPARPPPARPPAATPPVRRNPLEKSKILAKKKLEEACPVSCAICLETPKHKDAVCTECNHYYCKTCWSNWMNAERSNKKCPTCRKDMPITTTFKARATKRRLIIVED